MNKREKAVILLIALLLLTAVVQTIFTKTVRANFVFPPANPLITFTSPVNTSFNMNNLSFTVEFFTYRTGYTGALENASLRHFLYSVDNSEFLPIEITNASIGKNPGSEVYFYGLISLHQLSQGYHNLTVKVVLDYDQYPPAPINTHTENIACAYFIIDPVKDTTSYNDNSMDELPPLILFIASIFAITVIAVVGVLLHYVRLKR